MGKNVKSQNLFEINSFICLEIATIKLFMQKNQFNISFNKWNSNKFTFSPFFCILLTQFWNTCNWDIQYQTSYSNYASSNYVKSTFYRSLRDKLQILTAINSFFFHSTCIRYLSYRIPHTYTQENSIKPYECILFQFKYINKIVLSKK